MLDPAIDLAGPAHTMVSWLGTYFVHSTVLIGGVWMFSRYLPLDALTRSFLWKTALVGGLFTATLQTGLGVEPLLGTVSVASGTAPPVEETLPAPPPPPVAEVTAAPAVHACVGCETFTSSWVIVRDEGVTSMSSSWPHAWHFWDGGITWPGVEAAPPPPPPPPPAPPMEAPASEAPTGGTVPWLIAGLFLLGSMISVGRLGVTVARLRQGLRGRVAIHGPLRERLHRLLARACVPQDSVQLSMSERVGSPIALAGREIVVPERALELPPRQQEAMLAHELAHVLRRDPAWQVLAAVIEAALFFQPLNRVARRGMQEAAEELCDDWAVRNTGSGVHLARCLTEVAGWPGRGDKAEMLGSPMAARRSLLVRRVERLLDDRMRTRGRWARRWRGLLGAAFLALVGLGAPGLSLSLARAEAPETAELPLAPEPVFSSPTPTAPVLAMAPSAPVVVAVDEATPGEADARQRRLLRRALRHERKTEALRRKSGVIAAAPAVTEEREDDAQDSRRDAGADASPRTALEIRLDALGPVLEAMFKEQGVEDIDAALKVLDVLPVVIGALEELPETVRGEIEQEVGRLKQEDLAGKLKRLSELPELVRRQAERAQRGAARLSEEVKRELERTRPERGRARGPLSEDVKREIERAWKEAGRAWGSLPEEVKREIERASKAQGPWTPELAARAAERAAEQAERAAERAAELAERAAARAAEQAERVAARAAARAERAAEKAGKAHKAERARGEDSARVRAGAAVQAEVERALRDGVIDAEEAKRIQEAARQAAEAK
ncbi:MAG TPA: M56 family metallopeptidase [Nannocystis sp.]